MSNKISPVTGFRYILQGDMILKFSITYLQIRVRRDTTEYLFGTKLDFLNYKHG
jgi:hypothetical protein